VKLGTAIDADGLMPVARVVEGRLASHVEIHSAADDGVRRITWRRMVARPMFSSTGMKSMSSAAAPGRRKRVT
jgi:hypothetical protein